MTSTVPSNRNFNFRSAKPTHRFAGLSLLSRVDSNPVSRKFAYEFRFAKPPYCLPFYWTLSAIELQYNFRDELRNAYKKNFHSLIHSFIHTFIYAGLQKSKGECLSKPRS